MSINCVIHADSTYTQDFQNKVSSLSGNLVQTESYFSKMDYWKVKKANFNLKYQVSQISSKKDSNLTISINGTKIYSFKPDNEGGIHTKKIDIPTNLLQSGNELQITGQIVNSSNNKEVLPSAGSNWLTIYNQSTVNITYDLENNIDNISTFYKHFTGIDTISSHNTAIITSPNATNAELLASSVALAGQTRNIKDDNENIPIISMSNQMAKNAKFQMIIAKYNHLPQEIKKKISQSVPKEQAILQLISYKGKHILVVSADSGKLLKKAAQFVANSELMQQSMEKGKRISVNTATYMPRVNYSNNYQLTESNNQLTGNGHQVGTYFVNLPVERTNANGSNITINFSYARNLDFKRSLITILVNGTPVGSKKLSYQHANADSVTVHLPSGKAFGSNFKIQIAFDLILPENDTNNNAQTPWAIIKSNSLAHIKTKPVNSLLFKNYPSLFIKNQTFNNIAIVRPNQMTDYDFQILTILSNLIGKYTEDNSGKLMIYNHTPKKNSIINSNIIAFGTPKQNNFIRKLNNHLYFKYNSNLSGFVSNEKMSIENNYGKNIGTDQLLRSIYNSERGILIITGSSDLDTYLAATQINSQNNINQYSDMDAIVVDRDNNHYSYRFKKDKAIKHNNSLKGVIVSNRHLIIYLLTAILVMVVIIVSMLMLFKKYKWIIKGGKRNE